MPKHLRWHLSVNKIIKTKSQCIGHDASAREMDVSTGIRQRQDFFSCKATYHFHQLNYNDYPLKSYLATKSVIVDLLYFPENLYDYCINLCQFWEDSEEEEEK